MSENTKTVAEICKAYGMGQTELASRFCIPVRTVQDWYAGRRTPPAYVVGMMIEILDKERAAE